MGRPKKNTSQQKYNDNRVSLKPDEKELIACLRATGVVPNSHLISSDRNVIKLKENYGELKNRYEDLLRQHEKLQEIYNAAMHLENRDTCLTTIRPKSVKKTVGEATMCIVLSDLHVGEGVEKETVNGLNEYTPAIAQGRIEKFFEKSLFLADLWRKGLNVNNLVFAILGDIINNFLREEAIESNHLSPLEEVSFATDLICNGIDFLLKEGRFDQIIVPCCTGNHARLTLKPKISTEAKNSLEDLMYRNIQKIYKNNTKIHFAIPQSYHNIIKVYDYKIRFHHGHYIKYGGSGGGGIGGITIPANKAIAQWNKQESGIYCDVFGHHHQTNVVGAGNVGNFISCGSVIGWNTYAISIKASYEAPQQMSFLIDRERGRTLTAPIFLD